MAGFIEAFGTRLRDQVDLDTLTGELLAVVDQTMQPTPGVAVATATGTVRHRCRDDILIPSRGVVGYG